MNHLHNRDECKIVSGRQKKSICSLVLQNLCPEVHESENRKCPFLYIKKQYLIFPPGWREYVCLYLKLIISLQIREMLSPQCAYHRVWYQPTLPLFTKKTKQKKNPVAFNLFLTHRSCCVHCLDARAPPELVNCVRDTGLSVKQQQ